MFNNFNAMKTFFIQLSTETPNLLSLIMEEWKLGSEYSIIYKYEMENCLRYLNLNKLKVFKMNVATLLKSTIFVGTAEILEFLKTNGKTL